MSIESQPLFVSFHHPKLAPGVRLILSTQKPSRLLMSHSKPQSRCPATAQFFAILAPYCSWWVCGR